MISKNLIFNFGYLEVGNLHKIYYEQYGNPYGKPILFLHGGPGAGCSTFHKNFFDHKKYNVIFFDQRGSGKSTPYAETIDNTTDDLINDIELIRKKLNIDKWFIFGGSWGSTLGLLYGIKFPKNCLGFLLRGVFLGTIDEINWFLYGIKKFFPEAHQKFTSEIPLNQKNNILNWYHQNLNSNNNEVVLKAASLWNEYEISCSTLKYIDRKSTSYQSLAIARIETHYFVNDCFLDPNYIIDNIKKIISLPCVIIQGRHDVICPPQNAINLSKKLKKSKIKIVEDGGHSAFEESMFTQVVKSLNKIY